MAGASGAVGMASARHFASLGWRVVTLSRRRPELPDDLEHIAVDLRNRDETRRAVTGLGHIDALVYAALFEKPGLVAGWQEQDQMETNLAMLQNLVDPLRDSRSLRHVSLLQGTKAYGSHLHDIPIPARESLPRDDHRNFYWLQEDYLRVAAEDGAFSFTIFRPQLVISSAIGVAMNPVPVIAAYAAVCQQLGRPCGFPGGPPFVWEAVDSRLLAHAFAWAAQTPAAGNETFNITNGDIFAWRDLWPEMMAVLGVDLGEEEEISLSEFLPAHRETWASVVDRHRLRSTTINEILGEAHFAADYYFAYGQASPRTKLLSTVKLRQAGFDVYYDTTDTFRYWLRDMQAHGYVPMPVL
ncbi:SDR family oxidoreductase [Nocardioides sp. AN3]